MVSAKALEILRANTKKFIDEDPRAVVLMRAPRLPTGTGGARRGAAVAQPVQTMRLIPQAETTSTERRLPDGAVVVPTWVLLAEHTGNMLRGDELSLPDGGVGEVVYVHEKKLYHIKGEVVARGAR